jgi:hypothetical protein
MAEKAGVLLRNPPIDKREAAMVFMAQTHSWEQRVDTYMKLFRSITSKMPIPDELLR